MSTDQLIRRNILSGSTAVYVAPEGSALPSLSATPIPDSGGLLPFEASGTNAVQLLFLDSATGGTYTITYNDDQGVAYTTASLAYNAAGSAIQAALELLAPIGTGGVVVTAGADHVITFSGTGTQGRPQSLMVLNTGSLTGGASAAITETTAGTSIWQSVGLIENGVTIAYTPTFEDKFVDASDAPIDSFRTAENLSVEYEMAEKSLKHLSLCMDSATYTVINQASSQIGQTTMGVGDGTSLMVALALQGRSPQGKPRLFSFPKVKITAPTEDKNAKGANNVTVGYSVFSDISKAKGLRLFQYFDMTGDALA